jgi:eukaryotic-like serine/threonine-protein kinase
VIGTTLGDVYRVTREIGRGGMGAVYEGVHLRLNRRVAVKVMARELATNAEALARFRREAEVTSQLGHPHIVQVFDFGQAPSGEPYLVMEYLEGEDLEQRIQRVGPLSVGAAVHIVKQIASALGATHAKGIVHRDLKPANIFVLSVEGETDFVKVVDFGISKVKAATTRLTAAAAVMGTPNYMSPEQAAGRVDEIDQGTDQWALACIAYEMLAGRPPFIGENVASLLYQVVHEAPSPLAVSAPGLPPGIEEVLGAALAKRPAERFASITAFARAFEGAATGAQPEPLPASRPARGEGIGATLPASAAVAPASPAARQAPVTTFSAAVGEASSDGATASAGSRRWIAPVIGLVAVAAGVALVARSHAPPPAATAAVSAPAPSPVAVPAPAPAPVSAPAPPPPSAPAPAAPSSSAHARRRNGKAGGATTAAGAKASDSPAKAEADAPTWPPPSAAATPPPPPTAAPSRPSSYPPPPGSGTYPPPPGSAPATAPPQQKRHLVHDLKTKLFGD